MQPGVVSPPQSTRDRANFVRIDVIRIDVRGGPTVAQPKSSVSHAEQARARRLDAINFARRSVRLEGFILSDEVEEIFRRYVDDELSEEACTQAIQAVAGIAPHNEGALTS